MEEYVRDNPDFPQPSMVADAMTFADEHVLLFRYDCDDGVALLLFPSCAVFKFGHPNDEVLHGHPLHGKGLKYYAAQTVENSAWIRSLERQNSVQSQHDKTLFLQGRSHHVFTFQDGMLECVVYDRHPPVIQVVRPEEWRNVWLNLIASRWES